MLYVYKIHICKCNIYFFVLVETSSVFVCQICFVFAKQNASVCSQCVQLFTKECHQDRK